MRLSVNNYLRVHTIHSHASMNIIQCREPMSATDSANCPPFCFTDVIKLLTEKNEDVSKKGTNVLINPELLRNGCWKRSPRPLTWLGENLHGNTRAAVS